MGNLKCKMGLHILSEWEDKGKDKNIKYFDVLERKCKKCKHVEKYVGMTSVDIIDGSKTPYVSSL